jgi:hypothetical protein
VKSKSPEVRRQLAGKDVPTASTGGHSNTETAPTGNLLLSSSAIGGHPNAQADSLLLILWEEPA